MYYCFINRIKIHVPKWNVFIGKNPNCMWNSFQNWKVGTDCEVSVPAHWYIYDGHIKNVFKEKSLTYPTEIPQREIKLVLQILHYYFLPNNCKESIYLWLVITRFNRMRTVNWIYSKYEAPDFKKHCKTFFTSSASPLNYSSLCTFQWKSSDIWTVIL